GCSVAIDFKLFLVSLLNCVAVLINDELCQALRIRTGHRPRPLGLKIFTAFIAGHIEEFLAFDMVPSSPDEAASSYVPGPSFIARKVAPGNRCRAFRFDPHSLIPIPIDLAAPEFRIATILHGDACVSVGNDLALFKHGPGLVTNQNARSSTVADNALVQDRDA